MATHLKTLGVRSYKELIGKTMIVSFIEDLENKYEIHFRIDYFVKCNGDLEFGWIPASVSLAAKLQVCFLSDNNFHIVILDKNLKEYGYYHSKKGAKLNRLTNGKVKII